MSTWRIRRVGTARLSFRRRYGEVPSSVAEGPAGPAVRARLLGLEHAAPRLRGHRAGVGLRGERDHDQARVGEAARGRGRGRAAQRPLELRHLRLEGGHPRLEAGHRALLGRSREAGEHAAADLVDLRVVHQIISTWSTTPTTAASTAAGPLSSTVFAALPSWTRRTWSPTPASTTSKAR